MTNTSGGKALILLALIVGCGRGGLDEPVDPGVEVEAGVPAESGAPVGSGIPAATKIDALSDAQRRSLCDFINGRMGGYNHAVQCPSGAAMTDADQEQCDEALSALAGLCPTLRVGPIEACAAGPGGNTCTFETAPECQTLLACLNGI